jgi:hypothetical protein
MPLWDSFKPRGISLDLDFSFRTRVFRYLCAEIRSKPIHHSYDLILGSDDLSDEDVVEEP